MLASSAVTQVPINGVSTWEAGSERVQANGTVATSSIGTTRMIRPGSPELSANRTFLDSAAPMYPERLSAAAGSQSGGLRAALQLPLIRDDATMIRDRAALRGRKRQRVL